MLKKTLAIITGGILCLLSSCKEDVAHLVKVKLDNLNAGNIYAVFEADDMKSVDTLFYDGADAFTVTQAQADYRTLTLYFENHTLWITIYLEPYKKITLTGDILYPQLVKVKGGKINNALSEFREKVAALLKEQTDLSNAMNPAQKEPNMTERMSRWVNINHELCLQAEAYVEKHPDEEASAILIRDYLTDPDTPLRTAELLALLNPELADFYVVKELNAFIEKAKQTMTGAKAPDFNVANTKGTSYSRGSFRNRFLIMAFVSMWHDDCQTNELLLDEIRTSYSEDTLGIMLVCLDEYPQKVREQVRNDSIQWNIVTDSAGQAISLIDLYNVNVIPRCYLIDRGGSIVLKTENGVELKHMLEKIITEN